VRKISGETKVVVVETEDAVKGDLTAVLQTRNTKTSGLRLGNQ
jgi:hypothetical protein